MPNIRMSELRAGLASGKITQQDIANLRANGYGVENDEGGNVAAQPEPKPQAAAASSDGPNLDPFSRGTEGLKALGNMAVGAAKGLGSTVANIDRFARGATYGDFEGGAHPEVDSSPALETHGRAQAVGKFLEHLAEFMTGERAAAGAATEAVPALVAAAPKVARAVTSAIAGGAVTKAQGGSNTEAGVNAAIGGVGSAAADILPSIASKLKDSAIAGYEGALNAGSKWAKNLTKKVAPGLVEKGVVGSLGAIGDRAAQETSAAGDAIEQAWANLPPNAKVNAKPITDALDAAKDKVRYTGQPQTVTKQVQSPVLGPNGQPIVTTQTSTVTPTGFKTPKAAQYASNLDALKKVIADSADANGEVNAHDLRGLRQIWDEIVTSSPNNAYTGTPATLADRAAKLAHQKATDAVRGVINDAFPDIAELNKRFTFWKRTNDVVQDTLMRKTGQTGALEKVAALGGGMAGFGSGGAKGAAIGATLSKEMMKASKSGWFRTASAVAKDRLADAIVSGKVGTAMQLLRSTAQAATSNTGTAGGSY